MKKLSFRFPLVALALLLFAALLPGLALAEAGTEAFNPGRAVSYIGCAIGIAIAPVGLGMVMVVLHCLLLMQETP